MNYSTYIVVARQYFAVRYLTCVTESTTLNRLQTSDIVCDERKQKKITDDGPRAAFRVSVLLERCLNVHVIDTKNLYLN